MSAEDVEGVDLEGVHLPAFAAAVRAAAARVGTEGRFVNSNKVYVSAVWDALEGERGLLTMRQFEQLLVDSQRKGLLLLSRIDAEWAADPDHLRRSTFASLGVKFNVIMDTAVVEDQRLAPAPPPSRCICGHDHVQHGVLTTNFSIRPSGEFVFHDELARPCAVDGCSCGDYVSTAS